MQANGADAALKFMKPALAFANGLSDLILGPKVAPNNPSIRLRLNGTWSGKSLG